MYTIAWKYRTHFSVLDRFETVTRKPSWRKGMRTTAVRVISSPGAFIRVYEGPGEEINLQQISNWWLIITVAALLTVCEVRDIFTHDIVIVDPLAEEHPAIYQHNLCIADSTGLSSFVLPLLPLKSTLLKIDVKIYLSSVYLCASRWFSLKTRTWHRHGLPTSQPDSRTPGQPVELTSTAWSRPTVSVPTKAAEGQPNLAALICCIRSATPVK